EAEDEFANQFQARRVPADVPEVTIRVPAAGVPMRLFEVVVAAHLATSASEAKRLIQQGGIRVDDQRVEDPYRTLVIQPGTQLLVQRGRREFGKLRGIAEEER